MANFYTKYDYDENVTKEVVTGEAHTIPSSAPYSIYLRHIPRQESPSTVVIPGFTEVVGASPAAGEFRVNYGEIGMGRIDFNSADAGKAITVDYNACGTVIWAETYADGREGINKIQDEISGHMADNAAHGATALATANAIILRDASGRAKVAAPAATDDIAVKGTVDAIVDSTTGHKHTGTAGDGPQIDPSAFNTANWPAFRAYQSTNQSIAGATWTKVAYQTEVFDQGAVYDDVNYRFIAPTPGFYLFSAQLWWAIASDGERHILALHVNATEHSRLADIVLGGAGVSLTGGSVILKLNAGDYVEVFAYTSNARDTSSVSHTTYFTAVRVA